MNTPKGGFCSALLWWLKGLICLFVLVSTAFVTLVFFSFMTGVVLRVFSIHYSRRLTCFCFGTWLSLWTFILEKMNRTRIVFSGEVVPMEKRVLIIANHRTEVDWVYLWNVAYRKGCHGYLKYILKSSLMNLPVFGWGFHVLEFIAVKRRWEIDELTLQRKLCALKDSRDPLWLVIFPEGTDYNEKKCEASKKYAAENGLPLLKNVLLPKVKGFYSCLRELRESLEAVYDLTIAYKPSCPGFLDIILGTKPFEVHVHIRRVTLDNIPISEAKASAWLINTFLIKDRLLESFNMQGCFEENRAEVPLSMFKCFPSVFLVLALTFMCMFLIFSSIWVRSYALLACLYLGSSTYLDFYPLPIRIFLERLLFNLSCFKCQK